MSIFKTIEIKKKPRSNFDLSHEVKTTCEMGKLVPILCQEVIPGDTFEVNSQLFARMAPMLAPIMSRVDVYTHYFFVPNRLIWDNWETFITGGPKGDQFPVAPYAEIQDLRNFGAFTKGTLSDYLGLPVDESAERRSATPDTLRVSTLPFRAYQLIYNEWYRDQNLIDPVEISKSSDGNAEVHSGDVFQLRTRAWQKDYFTSALPWPQRGPEVVLPMKGDIGLYNPQPSTPTRALLVENYQAVDAQQLKAESGYVTDENGHFISLQNEESKVNVKTAAPTINEVRRSIRVQEWLEATARAGARYIEQLLSHFGVKSSDGRLDRPELLGGGKSPIMISEVLQTAEGQGSVGDMYGHGVSAQTNHGFKHYFEEHGFIMGIMSIIPKASYQDGVSRMWSRTDKFEYAWPEFANLGEQPILNQEICATDHDGAAPEYPKGTFGYAPRYSEYKYAPSTVHGDFRFSMNYWHLGRRFINEPKLNKQFIECDPDKRIFATTGGGLHHFYVQIYHNITAKRPLPYYGTPML